MIDLNNIYDKKTFNSSVLSFGNFDGLHLGHKAIYDKLTNLSTKYNLKSVIVTFRPNTKKVINNLQSFETLISFDLKKELLKKFGIDVICEINFDKKFSNISHTSFMELIIKKYNPKHIVLGYDNRFGKNGLGSYDFLINSGKYKHIKFYKINPFKIDDVLVKTSNIKSLIKRNNISLANKHLGRKFAVKGKVVKGEKIARTLGFPTANIDIEPKEQLIPSNGVYSVNLKIDKTKYSSICNIGSKPTFGSYDRMIEVHILNSNLDIYKKNVFIEFNYFIRKEIKFKDKNELAFQIRKDIKLITNKEKNSVK